MYDSEGRCVPSQLAAQVGAPTSWDLENEMIKRRHFIKSALVAAPSIVHAATSCDLSPACSAVEHPGLRPHRVMKGDGRGGLVVRPAEIQLLHQLSDSSRWIMPFGIAQMDNGEIIFAGTGRSNDGVEGNNIEKPIVGFSRDRGETWSDFQEIPGAKGRPMLLTYLGQGNLSFQTDLTNPVYQHFSHDYGRTWAERKTIQPPSIGGSFNGIEGYFGGEGNALAEFDNRGLLRRIGVIGYTFPKASSGEFVGHWRGYCRN